MAKPAILQQLRHGRLLCGAVFRTFVETWNWLVFAFDNLRGDWDVNPRLGYVTVDRRDPDHPVIRLARIPAGGGGGGGGSGNGMFEPVFENGAIASVGSGLFPYGREFITGATLDDSAKVANGFIVIEITHGTNPSAVIKLHSSGMTGITNTDTSKTVIPLYQVTDGAVSVDCRALLALAIRE